jgi:putative transposase
MSIRTNPFVVGEHYHIYNRGNSKQKIFLNQKDFQRFVDLLYAVNTDEKFNFADSLKGIPVYQRERESPLVAIAAYCLMPNHFHILLTPLVENGISKFMQKLSTGYVMYFNQKYKRTGALFEGKFKSQYVKDDKQLKYLFSYIH